MKGVNFPACRLTFLVLLSALVFPLALTLNGLFDLAAQFAP
jgi:hypothetical protein